MTCIAGQRNREVVVSGRPGISHGVLSGSRRGAALVVTTGTRLAPSFTEPVSGAELADQHAQQRVVLPAPLGPDQADAVAEDRSRNRRR